MLAKGWHCYRQKTKNEKGENKEEFRRIKELEKEVMRIASSNDDEEHNAIKNSRKESEEELIEISAEYLSLVDAIEKQAKEKDFVMKECKELRVEVNEFRCVKKSQEKYFSRNAKKNPKRRGKG